MPETDGDHKKLLTEVIKKQIIVLGPDITLVKARNVQGLTVADDGTVISIQGDAQLLTQKLIEQFMELSGQIVKKTMEPLLAHYPGVAQQVQNESAVNVTPPLPATPSSAQPETAKPETNPGSVT